MKLIRVAVAWIGLAFAVNCFAGEAGQTSALEQVRTTIDRVLAILQDPKLKSPDKLQERREQLTRTISARFDFSEMSRRSLGSEWRRMSAAQQRQFVDLFSELLRDDYVAEIESYKGEKVVYNRETREQDYSSVQTTLKSPDGNEYSIEYRLQLSDREWKVYDVVIENVSIVNNFRSQFVRVINRSGIDGLLRALQDKRVGKQK